MRTGRTEGWEKTKQFKKWECNWKEDVDTAQYKWRIEIKNEYMETKKESFFNYRENDIEKRQKRANIYIIGVSRQ